MKKIILLILSFTIFSCSNIEKKEITARPKQEIKITYDNFEKELKENLKFAKIERIADNEIKITINDLFLNKEYFNEKDTKNFNTIANLIKNDNETKIILDTFTDKVGSSDYAINDTKVRNELLRKELIKNGISKERIISNNNGFKNQLNKNKTIQNRIENRRTEITIITY